MTLKTGVSLRLPGAQEGEPTYEVIKKEDIEAAFRDALIVALLKVLSRIDSLVEIETATAPQGLWVWDYKARWDYDMWW